MIKDRRKSARLRDASNYHEQTTYTTRTTPCVLQSESIFRGGNLPEWRRKMPHVWDTVPLCRLYLVLVGFSLVFAPQFVMLSLQTSIEGEIALGATNVLVYSILCVISLLLYTPLVTLLGRKFGLVAVEIFWVIYTLSLLHPSYYTVIPASMLMGIAESIILPASGAIILKFITSEVIDDETRSASVARKTLTIGLFLAVLALGQTISSVMSELLLNPSDGDIWHNGSSIAVNISRCGASDCPMTYTSDAAVYNKLVPPALSFRVFLVLICAIQVVGIIMQGVLIPDDVPSLPNLRVDDGGDSAPLLPRQRPTYCHSLKRALYTLKSQVLSFRCLMILPIQIHYGLFLGFVWSEYTRAYVACIIGVQNIAKCLYITYFASFITNAVFTKFGSTLPIPALMLISYAAEALVFVTSLLWVPSVSIEHVSYALASLYGLAHGFRRLTFYVTAGVYFDDPNSAYLVQAGTAAIGLTIAYVWCEVLCVYVKIYIMLAHCAVATALAVIAHCMQFGIRL